MEEEKILHGILLKKAKEAQYTNFEIEQLNLQSESLFIRYFLEREAAKIVENTAENFGVRVSITWDQTPPVTYNDPDLTELLFENSKTFAEVVEARPSTAGEDFAFYQEKIPGVFAFIGSNGADAAPDLHHDTMTIDDEAFKVSVP